MTKIPVNEALLLVRDFGLLINQAAIYGVTHRVIQQQAGGVFNRLHSLAKAHETVEFSIKGDKLAVNGEIEGMDIMSTRNLKERMVLHKLPGIFFSPDLSQAEFISFLACLAKPPGRVHEMGGFEQVLKNDNVKGVNLVHFTYERVDTSSTKNGSTDGGDAEKTSPVKKVHKQHERPYELVLDDEFGIVEEPGVGLHQGTAKNSSARNKIQTELDALTDEVAHLVTDADHRQSSRMLETIRSIRDNLKTSTEVSKERIAALLAPSSEGNHRPEREKQVNVFNFKNAEMLQRFAELTQEIAQPLTVTNSVIELLGKGQAGPLTEEQTSLLTLALESVERVNQLIKYMHTLYGEPDSYIPDASIIQETYQ